MKTFEVTFESGDKSIININLITQLELIEKENVVNIYFVGGWKLSINSYDTKSLYNSIYKQMKKSR